MKLHEKHEFEKELIYEQKNANGEAIKPHEMPTPFLFFALEDPGLNPLKKYIDEIKSASGFFERMNLDDHFKEGLDRDEDKSKNATRKETSYLANFERALIEDRISFAADRERLNSPRKVDKKHCSHSEIYKQKFAGMTAIEFLNGAQGIRLIDNLAESEVKTFLQQLREKVKPVPEAASDVPAP